MSIAYMSIFIRILVGVLVLLFILFPSKSVPFPTTDREYFRLNEFCTLLSVNLGFPFEMAPPLTSSEWAVVRRKLGKPRRLSQRFFDSEIEKLNSFREDVRRLRAGSAPLKSEAHGLNLFTLKGKIEVNCRVVAFLWGSRSFQNGIVMASDESRYDIQFDDSSVGRAWVPDTWVTLYDLNDQSLLPSISESFSSSIASPLVPYSPRHQHLSPLLSANYSNFLLMRDSPLPPLTPGYSAASAMPIGGSSGGGVIGKHYTQAELKRCAQLMRINRMKSAVLKVMRQFHEEAERAQASGKTLGGGFKRAYSETTLLLQYCNKLAAPVLRDMKSPIILGANGAGYQETLSVLPSQWLRVLEAQCQALVKGILQEGVSRHKAKSEGFQLSDQERTYVSDVLTLVQCVHNISQTHEIYLKSEVNLPLENALRKLSPHHEENMDVYQNIERLMRDIVSFLADPIAYKDGNG